MSEVTDFLASSAGSKHPGFKFENIGDTIKGVVSEQPRVLDVSVLGKPGETERKMVVAVTDEGGDTWALWVKRSQMAQAINDAIEAAGSSGLEVGGRLAVKFSEERDTGKPSKMKVFTAQYQPPTPAPVGVADLL